MHSIAYEGYYRINKIFTDDRPGFYNPGRKFTGPLPIVGYEAHGLYTPDKIPGAINNLNNFVF